MSAYLRTTANTVFETLPGFTREGIPMSWDAPLRATGYIIYRQNSGHGDITWTPTDETVYTTATDITSTTGAFSDSKIVYAGNDTSTKDTLELEDDKTYQYKIFSHNFNRYYEAGPQRLSRTYPYMTIAGGSSSHCSTRFGKLRCWGNNNSQGVLGYNNDSADNIGDDEFPFSRGDVNIGEDVLAASIGVPNDNANGWACVLTVEGKVRCWGYGDNGRLGNNATTNILPSSFPPADVALPVSIIQITTGKSHACALLNTGAVRCWGGGYAGKTGYDATVDIADGTGTNIEDIGDVNVGTTVSFLEAGPFNTCVVTTSHKARCWGLTTMVR